MLLRTTITTDLDRIRAWIEADPFHRHDERNCAEFLLTGGGELTFHVIDETGPLFFVRLDKEGKMLRLAAQFGPESEVSKQRLVKGLLELGIPTIIRFGKTHGFKGIVFESTNDSLIKFMSKHGFTWTDGDDYALVFGDN